MTFVQIGEDDSPGVIIERANYVGIPKASPDAVQVAVDITGSLPPPGAKGDPGPAGTLWHSGAGAPAGALGSVGDRYLDTTAGDHYEKTASATWTLRGSLRGATGATGAAGATGPQGAQGISAYQVAVNNGFVGTEAEWLSSLQGFKGDKGDPGTLPPDGIPARMLLVHNGTNYPAKPVNGYAEFLGLPEPSDPNLIDGDIHTRTAGVALVTKTGEFMPGSVHSATTFSWVLPADIPAGDKVVLTFLIHNTSTDHAAKLSKSGVADRVLTPIAPVFSNTSHYLTTAVYVFDADADTAGSTFTMNLVTSTALWGTMNCIWLAGLKSAGSVDAVAVHTGTPYGASPKTSLTATTTLADTYEFSIAFHRPAVSGVTASVDSPMTAYLLREHTHEPYPGHGIAANLGNAVAAGTVIGGRTWNFKNTDGTHQSSPSVLYTFAIEGSAGGAPARLIRSGGAWQLMAAA